MSQEDKVFYSLGPGKDARESLRSNLIDLKVFDCPIDISDATALYARELTMLSESFKRDRPDVNQIQVERIGVSCIPNFGTHLKNHKEWHQYLNIENNAISNKVTFQFQRFQNSRKLGCLLIFDVGGMRIATQSIQINIDIKKECQ